MTDLRELTGCDCNVLSVMAIVANILHAFPAIRVLYSFHNYTLLLLFPSLPPQNKTSAMDFTQTQLLTHLETVQIILLWEGRFQRHLITNSCKWVSKRKLKSMYSRYWIFITVLDCSSVFPLKHKSLSLMIKEVIPVFIKKRHISTLHFSKKCLKMWIKHNKWDVTCLSPQRLK